MEKNNRPASEVFKRLLHRVGHLVADCSLCGRVHFATLEEGVYSEGELEELREKAKKDPEKYIEDPSYDTIAAGHLNNEEVVIDCPCNLLRKHEDFIWNNRELIVGYIKNRVQTMKEQVGREDKLLEGL